jgi:hypothetical protein
VISETDKCFSVKVGLVLVHRISLRRPGLFGSPLSLPFYIGIDNNRLYACMIERGRVTRVNSTNVLNKGLMIGEIGRRMNSKVKLVETGVYRK